MTLTQIKKLVEKKRKQQEAYREETLLTSPTSLSMKNSFLVKTVGRAFDTYYHYYKTKKKHSLNSNEGHDLAHMASLKHGKIEGNLPKPRDGHTGLIYNERYLVIFGGDRHHMPFNDLFTLDLYKEI